jgi:hypothetical protein
VTLTGLAARSAAAAAPAKAPADAILELTGLLAVRDVVGLRFMVSPE